MTKKAERKMKAVRKMPVWEQWALIAPNDQFWKLLEDQDTKYAIGLTKYYAKEGLGWRVARVRITEVTK